jgi:hypothetical protein
MLTGLPAAATAWMKSVWRQRNAGVCSIDDRGGLGDFVSACTSVNTGTPICRFDLGKDAQAFLHADAAKRLRRAAIGLVVRRLEDEWNAQSRADFLQLSRDVDLQLFRLDDARPGNEEQRPVQPDLESAQVHEGERLRD